MLDLLIALSQTHLTAEANAFPLEAQHRLQQQLECYHPADVKRQQHAFAHMHDKTEAQGDPWIDVAMSGSAGNRAVGEELLRQGKVGCIILAGGQGSRLGFEGPKGMMPVTPLHQKSLFQLFAERTKAASQRYGSTLPLCVMTSPLNHQQTVDYFAAQNNFGLLPDQLFFMQQNMLPLLNDEGGWLFAGPGRLAEGPDGNGEAMRHFCEQGIFSNWRGRGVEWVNVILVDNALADPFDAEFVGYASYRQSDVALKAVERLSPTEQMGVLVNRNGHLKVVEYSEFVPDGREYAYSSTSMFSFSMSFISRLYLEGQKKEMPLHLARKCVTIDSGKVHVWKCETFIFDLLDETRSAAVLVCPRENIFAPLKNAEGNNSLRTVQEALMHFDRRFYENITGTPVGEEPFELDPAMYYH